MLPLMHRFRLQLLQCKLATFVAIHVLLCSRCYELWQFGPLELQGYFYLQDSSNEDWTLPAARMQIDAVLTEINN